MLLLILSAALAQDPEHEPTGIQVVRQGETATAVSLSYLLPEHYYDACLVQAKQLRVADSALEECVREGVHGMEGAESALRSCQGQLVEDATDLAKLQTQLVIMERRQSELYRQRNTAWAVTGALTLGALAAVAVAL